MLKSWPSTIQVPSVSNKKAFQTLSRHVQKQQLEQPNASTNMGGVLSRLKSPMKTALTLENLLTAYKKKKGGGAPNW